MFVYLFFFSIISILVQLIISAIILLHLVKKLIGVSIVLFPHYPPCKREATGRVLQEGVYRGFPVNIVKFLKTSVQFTVSLKNTSIFYI